MGIVETLRETFCNWGFNSHSEHYGFFSFLKRNQFFKESCVGVNFFPLVMRLHWSRWCWGWSHWNHGNVPQKNHFTVPIFGWEHFNLMTCYCWSCPIGILELCSFGAPCVPDCRGTRFDDPCVTLGSILVILSLENMWKAVKCTDWNYWWKGEEVWTKNKKKQVARCASGCAW